MIIAIGSTNPLKINAVKTITEDIWPNVKIISVNSKSGVNEQPMTDDETIKGAIQRAKTAIETSTADYGIGIEAGVQDTRNGMFLFAWTAIINKQGKTGLGCTSRILIPELIANELRKGKELGNVIDELTKRKGIKHAEGTYGILTNGLITREESFKQAIISALAPFINELY